MRKKSFSIILLLCVCILLCSCSRSKKHEKNEIQNAKYGYTVTSEIVEIGSNQKLRGIDVSDNQEIFYSDTNGRLGAACAKNSVFLDIDKDVYLFWVDDECLYIGLNNHQEWILERSSLEGNTTVSINLSSEIDDAFPQKVMVDRQKNVYVWIKESDNDSILVLNRQGEVVNKISVKETVFDIGISKEGTALITYENNNKIILGNLDCEKKKIEKIGEIFGNGKLYTGIEKGILCCDSHFLYEYDIETMDSTIMINWIDCYINASSIQQIYGDSWEKINVVLWNANTPNFENEPITLSVLNKSETEERSDNGKKQLVLYKTGTDYRLPEIIMNFNKSNGDYEVILEESDEAAENAQFFLNTRLMTGDCPDMVLVDYDNYSLYKNAGALSDISVFFAKDDMLNPNDYFESVMQEFWEGDSLYGMPMEFSVSSLVGRKSQLGTIVKKNGSGCNTEAFLRWISDHPDLKIKFDGNPNGIMKYCLKCDLNYYVDFENQLCDFQKDSFLYLTKEAANIKCETDYFDGNAWQNEIETNQVVLAEESFWGFDNVQALKELYGEELLCVGYPNQEGELRTSLYPYSIISIATYSNNKEGAWEFWKYYMQNYEYNCFPTKRSAYENEKRRMQNISDSKIEKDDSEMIEELVGNGKIYGGEEWNTIYNIINDEMRGYYYGGKSLEETIPIIENRVKLYLME